MAVSRPETGQMRLLSQGISKKEGDQVLRDDAIRQGLIKPTKDDVVRMNLTKADLSGFSKADMIRLGLEKEEKPKPKTTKKEK